MKRFCKPVVAIIVVLAVLTAFTWQYFLTVGAMLFYLPHICEDTACDITPTTIAVSDSNQATVSELTIDNIVVPVPFEIATSTTKDNSVTVSDETGNRSVAVYTDALELFTRHIRSTTTQLAESASGDLAMVEVEKEKTFLEKNLAAHIEEKLAADPSQYALLRETLYFTPADVDYFAATGDLAWQLTKLQNKALYSSSDLYEFENSSLRGFIQFTAIPARDTMLASVDVFNKANNTYLRLYTTNLSREEVTDVIAGITIN